MTNKTLIPTDPIATETYVYEEPQENFVVEADSGIRNIKCDAHGVYEYDNRCHINGKDGQSMFVGKLDSKEMMADLERFIS